MEYVGWQVLTRGGEDDGLFELSQVPESFQKALPKFHRKNDLPPVEKTVRRTVVTATDLAGKTYRAEVPDPLGSPRHPFSEQDLEEKIDSGEGRNMDKSLAACHGSLAGRPAGRTGKSVIKRKGVTI